MVQPYKLSPLQRLFIPPGLSILSGCIDGGNGGAPDANSNSASNSAVAVLIDATAGGLGTNISDPANKYTYFNLDSGQIGTLSAAEASISSAWEIAFKRTSIKLNGGYPQTRNQRAWGLGLFY